METSKQATDDYGITEEDRVRWTRRLKWKWSEALIWNDSMLAALGNGVKGGKWFSLIDKETAQSYNRKTTQKKSLRSRMG